MTNQHVKKMIADAEPPAECGRCKRLSDFLKVWREKEPTWHNRPVRSFADPEASLLIVGLAPGLRGANLTGRPFTGDHAGDLLYGTLDKFGLSEGTFKARPDDGVKLVNVAITNAVRCVPPENKPIGEEMRNCRPFLVGQLNAYPNLKAVICLGKIAHDNVISALEEKRSKFTFKHGAHHKIGDLTIADSYHCSRYNTNTGRLTEAMFHDVFEAVMPIIEK